MRNLRPVALALAAGLVAAGNIPAEAQPLYLRNPHFQRQTALFDLYGDDTVDVVLLGTSLTAGAQWHELLRGRRVAARGIPSDLTEGFLARVDGVLRLHPRVCVIEGGINDLYEDIPPAEVAENIRVLARRLADAGIAPVIQSVLPVSPRWKRAAEKNREVLLLNDALRSVASDTKSQYLDLVPAMSEGGFLRDELSEDGVHLTAAGYAIWSGQLQHLLDTPRLR